MAFFCACVPLWNDLMGTLWNTSYVPITARWYGITAKLGIQDPMGFLWLEVGWFVPPPARCWDNDPRLSDIGPIPPPLWWCPRALPPPLETRRFHHILISASLAAPNAPPGRRAGFLIDLINHLFYNTRKLQEQSDVICLCDTLRHHVNETPSFSISQQSFSFTTVLQTGYAHTLFFPFAFANFLVFCFGPPYFCSKKTFWAASTTWQCTVACMSFRGRNVCVNVSTLFHSTSADCVVNEAWTLFWHCWVFYF